MANNFWQNVELEPKRNFRFILSVGGGTGFGISEFLVKQVKKPSFTVGEAPHNFLNHTFYYPGRVTWATTTFVIVDTVDKDTNGTKQVMKLLEASGYELPQNPTSGGGALKTISKRGAVRGLGQVYIKTLDADGTVVETWVLNNAWMTTADFGSMDYGTEDLINITVTMRFDNAYVNVTNDGNFPTTPGYTFNG